MSCQTFRYHPKWGAEIFEKEELDIVEKYGWRNTPRGFHCPPYDRLTSFKVKWQKKHNKFWDIEVYQAEQENKPERIVKPKKKQGRPRKDKK